MSIIKVVLYAITLAVLLFSQVAGGYVLYCIIVGFIYIEAKDPNIRNLLLIVILIDMAFTEVDYYVYYVSKYYIETGKVIGDLILNAVTILNSYLLILAIYLREEITCWLSKTLGLNTFEYRPTQADRLQLIMVRVLIIFHVVLTIIMSYYAVRYYTSSSDIIQSKVYEDYSVWSDYHLFGFGILQDIRLFCVVLVLHGFFGRTYPIKKMFTKRF